MKYRVIILMAIGVGLGVFGLKTLWDMPGSASGADAHHTVNVVVAACDITETVEITEAMVTLQQMPKSLAPDLAFDDTKGVVGRVAGVMIPRGSPVVADQLKPEGTPPGMGCIQPDTKRAVAIMVERDRDVAQWLKRGIHVDVVAVATISDEGQQHTVRKTILRDVEVLALEGGFLAMLDDADTVVGTMIVTINVVGLEKVSLLHLAENKGVRLRLIPVGQSVP